MQHMLLINADRLLMMACNSSSSSRSNPFLTGVKVTKEDDLSVDQLISALELEAPRYKAITRPKRVANPHWHYVGVSLKNASALCSVKITERTYHILVARLSTPHRWQDERTIFGSVGLVFGPGGHLYDISGASRAVQDGALGNIRKGIKAKLHRTKERRQCYAFPSNPCIPGRDLNREKAESARLDLLRCGDVERNPGPREENDDRDDVESLGYPDSDGDPDVLPDGEHVGIFRARHFGGQQGWQEFRRRAANNEPLFDGEPPAPVIQREVPGPAPAPDLPPPPAVPAQARPIAIPLPRNPRAPQAVREGIREAVVDMNRRHEAERVARVDVANAIAYPAAEGEQGRQNRRGPLAVARANGEAGGRRAGRDNRNLPAQAANLAAAGRRLNQAAAMLGNNRAAQAGVNDAVQDHQGAVDAFVEAVVEEVGGPEPPAGGGGAPPPAPMHVPRDLDGTGEAFTVVTVGEGTNSYVLPQHAYVAHNKPRMWHSAVYTILSVGIIQSKNPHFATLISVLFNAGTYFWLQCAKLFLYKTVLMKLMSRFLPARESWWISNLAYFWSSSHSIEQWWKYLTLSSLQGRCKRIADSGQLCSPHQLSKWHPFRVVCDWYGVGNSWSYPRGDIRVDTVQIVSNGQIDEDQRPMDLRPDGRNTVARPVTVLHVTHVIEGDGALSRRAVTYELDSALLANTRAILTHSSRLASEALSRNIVRVRGASSAVMIDRSFYYHQFLEIYTRYLKSRILVRPERDLNE